MTTYRTSVPRLAIFWILLFVCSGRAQPPVDVPLQEICNVRLKPPRIRFDLPDDVEGALKQKNLAVVQRASDIFSWQEFIALNWPAAQTDRGVPDRDKQIKASGPRLWETWKEEYEVYREKGAPPLPWSHTQEPPGGIDVMQSSRLLFRRHKVHDFLDAESQAAKSDATLPATLKDQNGNLVRYEIRMNKVMFDYIVQHQLYNGYKQAAFGDASFPNGSIIIKAAWKEIGKADSDRFLSTDAFICEHDAKTGRILNCRDHTTKMGLVGLHIMAKTPSAPQWIWSTFEQVDNVTGNNPSFFNPSMPNRPTNLQTQQGIPNQVQRVVPIPATDPNCKHDQKAVDNIRQLNKSVQHALAENRSVLQHYELVSTQWPYQVPLSPVQPTTVFDALPEILSNTTMETFVQPTSSCIGCHSRARTLSVDRFASSDFTFTLNNARPKPTNPWIIPKPTKPKTPWDKAYWKQIRHGEHLANNTYEAKETKPHVAASLHCSSCHLDAGRNPSAAWWVGMIAKYEYPETTNLQARINRCFLHSMNGSCLCSTDDMTENPCDYNVAMNSFITYMQWLDEQSVERLVGTMANGFPQIQKLVGNQERGKKAFLQKCAVCHGKDGEGRYASDTYFRPALWGEHSFNKQAGLYQPEKLAPFLKANMPLGAGGMLTDQEAWDLAEFIHSQPRPPRPSRTSCLNE